MKDVLPWLLMLETQPALGLVSFQARCQKALKKHPLINYFGKKKKRNRDCMNSEMIP